MLPAMVRVSKYMWRMFYLLLNLFPFSYSDFLLIPQATSLAVFKLALYNYKIE